MAYSPIVGGQHPPKKMSKSMLILAGCLLGVVFGLFGLNYWHTTKCADSKSPDEIEAYIEGINRRLLQAESQTIKNGLVMEKLLNSLQTRLIKLESLELLEITKQSQDEAVRLAILLASQPAPPMPEFELDLKYQDAEVLADAIDDVFGKSGGRDDYSSEEKESWEKYDDHNDKEKGGDIENDNKESVVTDSESKELCLEWRKKYSVVQGVSWGNLPHDLQQKWLKYSCDYHLPTGTDGGSAESNKIISEISSEKVDKTEIKSDRSDDKEENPNYPPSKKRYD